MKIKQSETVDIKRSEINFAAYNPRKKNEKVIASLKRNFKKVGFMGGIVVNELSGNIVSGHKRVETMDLIHKYNGKNDYKLKVEIVTMDAKTEKEQNIYMNNKAVQGEFDYKRLAEMADEISFDNAGLTEFDIDKIAVFAPSDEPIEVIKPEKPKPELTEEQKAENIENLKELKKKIRKDAYGAHDDAANAHLTLVFDNYDNKIAFMEMMELDSDKKMIKGEEFAEKLELFNPDFEDVPF